MKNEENYDESIPLFLVKTEDVKNNDGVNTPRWLTGVYLLMLALPLLGVVMTATTMALTLFTGSFLSISSEQQQPTHQLNE